MTNIIIIINKYNVNNIKIILIILQTLKI